MLSTTTFAQGNVSASSDAVFARLGYESTWPVRGAARGVEGFSHVCVVIRQNGDYILQRKNTIGITQVQKGTLANADMERVSQMLNAADLRNLPSNNGSGVIKGGSQTFVAEIWRKQQSRQYLKWRDIDGTAPFPASIAIVVAWLRQFNPKGAQSMQIGEESICLRSGRSVRPLLAGMFQP
jgi:hypothetical protein